MKERKLRMVSDRATQVFPRWMLVAGSLVSLLCFFLPFLTAKTTHHLSIFNNGPAVLDSSVTFSTILFPPLSMYGQFQFEDGLTNVLTVNATYRYNLTKVYDRISFRAGTYAMRVTVILEGSVFVANTTQFVLMDSVPGTLNYFQMELSPVALPNYVLTGLPVIFYEEIHDPNDFLRDTSVTRFWTLKRVFSKRPVTNLNYTFSSPTTVVVSTTVIFRKNAVKLYYGFYERQLTAVDPISDVRLVYYALNEDSLDFHINCTGGGHAFRFCWQLKRTRSLSFIHDSCSSSSIVKGPACSFHLKDYLPTAGFYHLHLHLLNEADLQIRRVGLFVYTIPPELRRYGPLLITFIIMVMIAALASVIFLITRKRPRQNVEVADFDIQVSLELVQPTKFQYWRHCISDRLSGLRFWRLTEDDY